jgi:cytochrome c oxidase subunit I+III
MYSEVMGKTHFVASFVGFNLMFFPMFYLFDMPRRIFTYTADTGWGPANFISSVGAYIFIPSQLLIVGNMLWTLRKSAPRAPSNPWNATTPEWVSSPEQLSMGGLGNGLGNGIPHSSESSHELSHLSTRPILVCLGFAVGLSGLAFGWPIILVGGLVTAWGLVGWAWDDRHGKFTLPEEPEGERWPFHGVPKNKLAMWTFLGSESVLFAVLLGSYGYIRLSFPFWPAPGSIHSITLGTLDTLVVLTSSLTCYMALQSIKSGSKSGLVGWLGATLALGLGVLGLKGYEWYDLIVVKGFNWTNGLPGSTYFVTTGIHAAHIIAGVLILVYVLQKALKGGFSNNDYGTVENFNLYWSFVTSVWLVIFPLFYLI